MAMRALLRSAASRAGRSRSAAVDTVLPVPRDGQLGLASVASSSASPALSETLQSSRFLSSMSSSESLCVREFRRSFSTPPSFTFSASGSFRNPSLVPLFLFASSSVAPLSSDSAALRPSMVTSLADLRLGRVHRGAQQLVADSSGQSALMQQRRYLSKLKNYKMKPYSSYKERFKLMADGTYKRWRSGTRHNAHSKTAKQRRQLRRPSVAPAALAKVMKKLNFVR